MAADHLHLIHDGGVITLHQATPPRFTESRDLTAFRAPFGDVPHKLGTGKALPTALTLRGTLRASNFVSADDALAELEDALPGASAIEINGQRIPVMATGGVQSAVPLLTGWRVTLQLLSHPEAALVGPTADSTTWTADSTQVTADQLAY